jgi:hypothetical protein
LRYSRLSGPDQQRLTHSASLDDITRSAYENLEVNLALDTIPKSFFRVLWVDSFNREVLVAAGDRRTEPDWPVYVEVACSTDLLLLRIRQRRNGTKDREQSYLPSFSPPHI